MECKDVFKQALYGQIVEAAERLRDRDLEELALKAAGRMEARHYKVK